MPKAQDLVVQKWTARLAAKTTSRERQTNNDEELRDITVKACALALHEQLEPIMSLTAAETKAEFPMLLRSTRPDEPTLPTQEETGHAEEEQAASVTLRPTFDEIVYVNGQAIAIWEYLGEEWSTWINELHSLPEYEYHPDNLHAEWYPHQLTGIAKMLAMAESSMRGGINADEMGLGKTYQSIAVGEILRQRHGGGFNLVLAPKSCLIQWSEAIEGITDPVSRVLILDNPNTTANELLDAKFDWVLCTYQYAVARFARLQAYGQAFDELSELTTEAADRHPHFKIRRAELKERPAAPLHSDVYELLGLPINCLFLDEAQAIKSETSKTYEAVKAIPARFRFALSGTIFANRWSDVFALTSILHGLPIQTRADFQRAFARKDCATTVTPPTVTKKNRAIKYLQGMVFSRPASVMQLPDKTEHNVDFWLADKEVLASILYLVQQFYDGLRRAGQAPSALSAYTSNGEIWKEKAIYCINIAQCVAANPHMLMAQDRAFLNGIKQRAIALADDFMEMFSDKHPGSVEYYHAVMSYIENQYNKKRKGDDGQDERESKRAKADPYVAEQLSDLYGENLQARWKANEGLDAGDKAAEEDEGQGETNLDTQPLEDDEAKLQDDDDNDNNDEEKQEQDEEGEDAATSAGNGTDVQPTAEERYFEKANDELRRTRPTRTTADLTFKNTLSTLSQQDLESPRIKAVMDCLDGIRRAFPKQRVLVFSKFRRFLDILDLALKQRHGATSRTLRFDGAVKNSDRPGIVADFARDRPNDHRQVILLITAGCGGAGLNLAQASHVVLCEPWWRNSDIVQAIGRVFRTGQELEVHVHRVAGVDSMVDLVMERLANEKAKVIAEFESILRRVDGDPPIIPPQFQGSSGELY